jgi:hypothetical protein
MGFNDANGNYHAYRASILLSLDDFRECDANGDVGAIAANGGLLASDTTPILRGAASLISQEISWAAGNADPIRCQVALPEDFDGRNDVLVDLWGYSGGTTNAVSFTVASSWDGGATVSDTAIGLASATSHRLTATIAASDIPDGASFVTLLLTPAAHATDTMQLQAARVRHVNRPTS